MLFVVIFFLALSLLLYTLLAGADFGAGILEIFSGRKDKTIYEEMVNKALGPVWEANHIWIIIAVVILFNGFPEAYAKLSVIFHIPLMLMLLGIVFRGCAFSFRHYDRPKDKTHKYYSFIFSASSVLTPAMFGMIIGALLLGRIAETPSSYYETYVAPWLNPFSFSVGVFVVLLFTFIASVYMIGENQNQNWKKYFIHTAKIFQILTVVAGGVVFVLSRIDGPDVLGHYLSHPPSLACLVLATVTLPLLWRAMSRGFIWLARMCLGAQVTLILSGWFLYIFPTIIFSEAHPITFYNAAAPDATLEILGWSLIIGSVIFLPVLACLYGVFKYQKSPS